MESRSDDIWMGITAIIILYIVSISFSGPIAGFAFIALAIYFLTTGLDKFFPGHIQSAAGYSQVQSRARRASREEPVPQTSSAPINAGSTIAEQIRKVHADNNFKCTNCGATIYNPTDRKCRHCDSMLVDMTSLPKPETWADVEIGQNIRFVRFGKDEINAEVVHRIYYAELWQEKMETDVPWTLTGSYYVGLGLNNDMLLLNWQSRYYLLDERSPLTDMDINRDFAQYARKFAASNQTASVTFHRDGTRWKIFDIGRFRIEFAEGEGIKVSAGAVGRFIYAKADDHVLIVEDFQSGGNGSDTLWTGYEITKKDIKM
ncbi:MAG: hypothetical protein IT315_08865 [Anaerolineales bacterium]|nr:hypothetical protein [Anaerolineales bacterium]